MLTVPKQYTHQRVGARRVEFENRPDRRFRELRWLGVRFEPGMESPLARVIDA